MSNAIPVRKGTKKITGCFKNISAFQGRTESLMPTAIDARKRSDALKNLLGVVDAKDPYTYGHSLRVTQIALMIGKSMGFSQKRLRFLYESSCLHDLGKTTIPDEILNKTGRLDHEEMLSMQRHSQIGHALLCEHPLFNNVAQVVLAHHERWDGLGYPFGLKGEKILLEARIIAVADAFDAMTSDRPYRKGLCHSYGIQEIQNHSGDQFDPVCVDHFCRIAGQISHSSECLECLYGIEEDHESLMHSKKVYLRNPLITGDLTGSKKSEK